MKSFGQLVHTEQVNRDGVSYQISVYRVQAGLYGRWRCEACLLEGDEGVQTHPTAGDCVRYIQGFVDAHHRQKH